MLFSCVFRKDAQSIVASFHRLPRYDVDVLTRCITYFGIGFNAVYGIPLAFHYLGMETSLF